MKHKHKVVQNSELEEKEYIRSLNQKSVGKSIVLESPVAAIRAASVL